MPKAHGGFSRHWTQRRPAAFDEEAPPVQNTWYTILDTILDTSLWYILLYQNNDEDVAKNVNLRITIDGRVLTRGADKSQADNSYFYWHWMTTFATGVETVEAETFVITAGSIDADQAVELDSHSIKVEMRMTSVPGTNQILRGLVFFDRFRET